jgi:hypothetical protein
MECPRQRMIIGWCCGKYSGDWIKCVRCKVDLDKEHIMECYRRSPDQYIRDSEYEIDLAFAAEVIRIIWTENNPLRSGRIVSPSM